MSQANIPNITPSISIDRDQAINLLLASVAMEELGLSHILNAEGEKIQYALGTIPGLSGPSATIAEIISVNKSVQQTLEAVWKQELMLDTKLNSIISIASIGAGITGPTGPTGVASTLNGLQVQSVSGQLVQVNDGDAVVFDVIKNNPSPNISYAMGTGEVSIIKKGNYQVSWGLSVNGGLQDEITLAIKASDGVSNGISVPFTTGQISSQALLTVNALPYTFKLINLTGSTIQLAGVPIQANLVVIEVI